MQFGILGPVELFTDAGPVAIAKPRHRAILAYLLLHPNRVVPLSELFEALWGGAEPATARSQVHVGVSELRRALRAEGLDQLIVTRPSGYELRLGDGLLDAHIFAGQVAAARLAIDSGRHRMAEQQLEQALGLWRGPALGGVNAAFAEPARAALQEQFTEAQEIRFEAGLAHGRHLELVAELSGLAVEHPLRERLVCLLMLALYRSGRSADALDAARRYRATLVDQHGLDPTDRFLDLERAILNADPALARQRRAPAAGNLPMDILAFAGRDDELSQLDSVMARANRQPTAMTVCLISGPPGAGKTTLAVHWAHRVAHEFPGGCLYVDLRGFDPSNQPLDTAEGLHALLVGAGITPDRIRGDLAARTRLFQDIAAQARLLVILDNAADAEQVRSLLPAAPGAVALVASRRQLPSLVVTQAGYPIHLDPLLEADAVRMLSHRLGRRAATAHDELARIATACGHLPLALALVAGHAAAHPRLSLHDIAEALHDDHQRLNMMQTETMAVGIRAAFDLSYRRLTAEAAHAFRLFSISPGPRFGPEAGAALLGTTAAHVHRLVAELAQVNLVVEPSVGRHSFHDLIRLFAVELCADTDSHDVRREALGRILDHYAVKAYAAVRHLDPNRERVGPWPDIALFDGLDSAMAWLVSERSQLVAAVLSAQANGFHDHAIGLAWNIMPILERRGHWQEDIIVQEASLRSARELSNPHALARGHRSVASAHSRVGQQDKALEHYRTALQLYRELDDHLSMAHVHNHLALVFERRGESRPALEHTREALHSYTRLGNRQGEGRCLNTMGFHLALLGEHEKAVELCRRAVTILADVEDRRGQAYTWDSLGDIHLAAGDASEAINSYQRALDCFRYLGAIKEQARILWRLAEAHENHGDPDAAAKARAAAELTDIV